MIERDDAIFRIYQEVNRQTIAENKAFDLVFNQLSQAQQHLLDERLGQLLNATIRATINAVQEKRRR
jgi:hypothetical protein